MQTLLALANPAKWTRASLLSLALAALGIGFGVWSELTTGMVSFVITGLISVAPIISIGILLTAWIIASGADSHVAGAFEGRTAVTILMAAIIGAITPICGVTVLPLMTGLLAAGIPLAPVMAFWLSSPITDPAMLATTAATLGPAFAIGKTVSAFVLGLYGGSLTAILYHGEKGQMSLRDTGLARRIAANRCGCQQTFQAAVWRDTARRQLFVNQALATTRLILLCLIPAFAAEFALNAALTPDALAPYAGADKWWAIPAAVFVGAPAYIDGYAALPLTRGLVDNGMSPGAAMAFLVSGGVVSIWGALAIFPVLRLKPFLLYLGFAVTGAMVCGYVFGWLVQP